MVFGLGLYMNRGWGWFFNVRAAHPCHKNEVRSPHTPSSKSNNYSNTAIHLIFSDHSDELGPVKSI